MKSRWDALSSSSSSPPGPISQKQNTKQPIRRSHVTLERNGNDNYHRSHQPQTQQHHQQEQQQGQRRLSVPLQKLMCSEKNMSQSRQRQASSYEDSMPLREDVAAKDLESRFERMLRVWNPTSSNHSINSNKDFQDKDNAETYGRVREMARFLSEHGGALRSDLVIQCGLHERLLPFALDTLQSWTTTTTPTSKKAFYRDILACYIAILDTIKAILSSYVNSSSSIPSSTTTRNVRDAGQNQAAEKKLQAPSPQHSHAAAHVTAVLAPLTQHITHDGTEAQTPNPIRILLFQVLQSCLEFSGTLDISQEEETIFVEKTCQCLLQALLIATNLEGTCRHAKQSMYDVEPHVMRSFVARTLGAFSVSQDSDAHHRGTILVLKVLHALLQRHPDMSLSFTSDLLLQLPDAASSHANRASSNHPLVRTTLPCPTCHFCQGTPFLYILHASFLDSDLRTSSMENIVTIVIVCMKIVTQMLQHLPLTLWLQSPSARSTLSSTMRPTSLTFADRVRVALQTLVNMAVCWLERLWMTMSSPPKPLPRRQHDHQGQQHGSLVQLLLEKVTQPLMDWVQACIRHIPLKTIAVTATTIDKSTNELEQALLRLVHRRFELWLKHMDLPNAMGTPTSSSVSESSTRLLVELMGGQITPNGQVTPMCPIVKRWLSCDQSRNWMEELVRRTGDEKHVTRRNATTAVAAHTLLGALLRTFPSAVLQSASTWRPFQQVVAGQLSLLADSSKRAQGMRLVEVLLLGRQYQSQEHHQQQPEDESVVLDVGCDTEVAEWVMPLLLYALMDERNTVACRISVCTALGCLSVQDWTRLRGETTKTRGRKSPLSYEDDDNDDDMDFLTLVTKRLLALCSTKPVKLQSTSCKAIGDICAHLLSDGKEDSLDENVGLERQEYDIAQQQDMLPSRVGILLVFLPLLNVILETMSQIVVAEDSPATVRCMSLYVVGNVARALGTHYRRWPRHGHSPAEFMTLTPPPSPPTSVVIQGWAQLAYMCLDRCLVDPDEKTVGNAIRSLGHVTCLLLYDETSCGPDNRCFVLGKGDVQILDLVAQVVRVLTEKVKLAVELALQLSNESAPRAQDITSRPMSLSPKLLSWKRRSAIKKHGWGACNALAMLFECVAAIPDEPPVISQVSVLFDACQPAMQDLLRCLHYIDVLNEKIVVAAMRALRCLSSTTLLQYCGNFGITGEAVTSCILWLMKQPNSGNVDNAISKLREEIERTLSHLLSALTVQDASRIFSLESQPQAPLAEVLSFLFHWMVKHDLRPECFVPFALAFQHSNVAVDIQIEQCFSSKAIDLGGGQDDYADDDDEL